MRLHALQQHQRDPTGHMAEAQVGDEGNGLAELRRELLGREHRELGRHADDRVAL
jgi:hypothetical protein